MKNIATIHKPILLLYVLFSTPYFIFAQPNIDKKRDYNYFTGYESRNHHIADRAGTTLSKFKYCIMNQNFKYNPLDFKGTVITMSDTSGKILFTFNGYKTTDTSYQIMQNGDSLCVPDYVSNNGSYIAQGAITIPKPNSNHIYYIFHHAPSDNGSAGVLKYINITTIDMYLNNGRGAVRSREQKIIRGDTAAGCFFKVCRHANGRDWWLLRPSIHFDKYYRLLITPNGIDSLAPQIMPPLPTQFLGSNSAAFSLDGAQFAHKVPYHGIYVYDFDRCNGELTNRRYVPRVTTHIGEVYAGICFSPNSRYLYCTTDTSVVQYDTYANDIPNSAITVGLWDGTTVSPPQNYNTKFFQPFNAPNGKIYINSPSTGRSWHTIHNPDGAGTTCDLRLHDVLLPTIYYGTTPNFPNFRLGALRGSACDTLGIEEGADYVCEPYVGTEESPLLGDLGGIKVYPNPANEYTRIEWNENIKTNIKIEIINNIGQIIEIIKVENNTIYKNIDTKNLPNGIYFIRLSTTENQAYTTKLIKISD